MDVDEIAYGANFADAIALAVRSSKCFLFFSSEHSNQSKWAEKELIYARVAGLKILPIKLDDTPYSNRIMFEIGNINWFESSLKNREDLEKLLDIAKNVIDN